MKQGTTRSNVRKISLTGIFAVIIYGLGKVLSPIPNFELVIFTVFLSGVTGGCWVGVMAGFLGMMLHSIFNPLGVPVITVLLGQVIGASMVGLAGGLYAKRFRAAESGYWSRLTGMMEMGAVGLVLTVVYDLVTTLALIPVLQLPAHCIFLQGTVYYLFHLASNTFIFSTAGRLIPLIALRFRG